MATKKRILDLLEVFCLSVLTVPLTARVGGAAGAHVTVQNTASNPVPVTGTVTTQNVGRGAATLVGQLVSQLVSLVCTNLTGGSCVDGTQMTYTVPAGKVLVITDLQFNGVGIGGEPVGSLVFATLSYSPSFFVNFAAPLDPNGHFYGQDQLTTGIVAPPGSAANVALSGAANGRATLQGYLVPNL